ncbi:glycosyltransferase [Methylobacterium sp. J-030]|uniref:glycosyltransferase n=1 Tax=Methylobacterium sp. J-030 TaxID=2836627 RepID=UPI001FBB3A2B|nr:glycosyltransferase [Methylobacterium sp. J-030]MCJ2071592.1 glycosyltransferase [Methylobacterium sp. J-030]
MSVGEAVDLPVDRLEWRRHLPFDPQTSGGLPVTCAADRVEAIPARIRDGGHPAAARIGRRAAAPANPRGRPDALIRADPREAIFNFRVQGVAAHDACAARATLTDASVPSPPAHGIVGWPFGPAVTSPARPRSLPDGRPWPRIRIVTVVRSETGLGETVASVLRQDYSGFRHDLVAPGEAHSAVARILDDHAVDHLLWLDAGDLLAPGALTALALEAALTGAAAVAGLRVLFDTAVRGLDSPAFSGASAVTGSAVLWARGSLGAAALIGADGTFDAAAAWSAIPEDDRRTIGRPVLLHRQAGALTPSQGLSIVSLTGTGTQGGAGVAQRRLAEALALAGHHLTPVALSDRPEAAEWADSFPQAEAVIASAAPDLVLAGNLHGATRSLDVVDRLRRRGPVALVLHDLFPLTGRCAHPRDCRRAAIGCDAACPGPDEYPQLAPRRIAGMHARKRAALAGPAGPWLLANSDWTLARARELAPPGTPAEPIRLAFPTAVFRPGDRAALRRRLGLPPDDVLILISAVIVDGPDKGFHDLRAALRDVARPGVGVVAIGRLDDPAKLGIANLFAPGLIADEATLAAWYGACDLHATASRHETLGQTPIEAGLCGVPTLAYRTSGLTSAVIDGVSGRLVPVKPGALAEALAALVDDPEGRARLGAFARIALESRYSPAAAALSLEAIFRRHGLRDAAARPTFEPAMLGHFAFAAVRQAGAVGTVPAASRSLVRYVRRAKQMVLGRRMPLLVRRCLYLAGRLRRSLP